MLKTLEAKLISLPVLIRIVKERQQRGEHAVFTNGCFDILHTGHLRYLEKARETGDFLIIGLNSDSSVRHLKGSDRPFINELERAEMLSAFVFVDYIVIFSELTPCSLINDLRPDIHVKGGDYRAEDLPEFSVVKSYGGKVLVLEFTVGKSTTSFVNEIYTRLEKNKP